MQQAAAVTLLLLQFFSADSISRRTSVTLSGGSARLGEGKQALDNRDKAWFAASAGLPPGNNGIVVGVWMLQPGEDQIVGKRLQEVLGEGAK